MDIITGEKIQHLCDHYICTIDDLNYNPNNDKSKFIDINTIDDYFDNKLNIFCYTHSLINIDMLIAKLKFMKNKFNIIFHNSDQVFISNNLRLFEIDNLIKIYTQNMHVLDSRVLPLPIGIQNKQWCNDNISLLNEVILCELPKTNYIYFYFDVNTNRIARTRCFLICNNLLNIQQASKCNFKEYLYLLTTYKFCICPVGNGIDTHRFWECLYLKVVPIVLRIPLTEYYSKFFPVVLLNDWTELSDSLLSQKEINWDNYNMLDLSYIKIFIN
jgi:hypothetical protein